jgi:hypothetical protein
MTPEDNAPRKDPPGIDAEIPPWVLDVGPEHFPEESTPPWLKKHLYCWVPRLTPYS